MNYLRIPVIMALCAMPLLANPQEPAHWKLCAACHGADGHGNKSFQAPAIAGLPDWYVKRQLEKFRTNVRGAHPDDVSGHLMRPMARALPVGKSDEMSSYVASLTKKPMVDTIGGDPVKGKALYAVCAACHGVNGEGNPLLKAPSQVGLDDWYMLDQLKKFKDGLRGKHPKDVEGMTMAPILATLADEEAMKDVIAYIRQLPGTPVAPPPVAQN